MAWSLPQELTDQIVSVAYHTSANPSETLKALCLSHSTFRAQARRLVFGHVSLEWPTLYPRSYRQSTHAFRDLLKRSAGEIGLLVRTLQVTGAPDPSRDPAVLHVLAALPLLTEIVFASCGTAIMRMVAAQLPRLLPPLVERVAFLDNYYVESSEDMYALVGKFPRLKGLELRDAFWHRYISKQAVASIALKTLTLSSDGIGSDGELDREDILQFLLHPASPVTLSELETLNVGSTRGFATLYLDDIFSLLQHAVGCTTLCLGLSRLDRGGRVAPEYRVLNESSLIRLELEFKSLRDDAATSSLGWWSDALSHHETLPNLKALTFKIHTLPLLTFDPQWTTIAKSLALRKHIQITFIFLQVCGILGPLAAGRLGHKESAERCLFDVGFVTTPNIKFEQVVSPEDRRPYRLE